MTGKLIVFEGSRGAGKSTCLRGAAAWLRFQGHDVVETAEPTRHLAPGALARSMLVGDDLLHDPRSFQLICAADRLEHAATIIRPALAAGKVVLCDRYVLSSVAHSPTDRVPFPWDWVLQANRFAPLADLTVVLYVPPEVGARRVMARDGRLDVLADSAVSAPRFYADGSALATKFSHSRTVTFVNGLLPSELVLKFALEEVEAVLAAPAPPEPVPPPFPSHVDSTSPEAA